MYETEQKVNLLTAKLPARPTINHPNHPNPWATNNETRGTTSQNLQQALQQAKPKPPGGAQANTQRPTIGDKAK
jgi:hypothetical protein